MIWVYLATALIMGVIIGVACTQRAIQVTIEKADICSDDKRIIRDVLGIPHP